VQTSVGLVVPEVTAGGAKAGGNAGENPRQGERFAGKTPQALPARNKAGKPREGASRREGNQTLRAEGGGQAKPA